jgi:UDP-N-acetylglucosamine 2-epimerase (non-hydrolysing)
LPYFDLLDLVSKAKLVITDSGGIQEECAFFKKKVIVCRKNTERPEGIDAGLAQLATPEKLPAVFDSAILSSPWTGMNPYGDGQASLRIVDSIEHFLRN